MNPYYIIYALFFHTCIYHTSLYTDYRSTGWIFYLFILGKDAVSGSSLARSVKISSSEATCYRLDGPFAENDGKGWTSWVGARHMSSCVLPEFSFTQRLFLKFSQLDLIMRFWGFSCLVCWIVKRTVGLNLFEKPSKVIWGWPSLIHQQEAKRVIKPNWIVFLSIWVDAKMKDSSAEVPVVNPLMRQVFKWSTLAVSLNASLVPSNLLPDEWLVAFLCK